jgi:hypothetical protein
MHCQYRDQSKMEIQISLSEFLNSVQNLSQILEEFLNFKNSAKFSGRNSIQLCTILLIVPEIASL